MLFIITKIVLFVEKKKKERKETFGRSSRSYNFNALWHDHVTVFRSLFFLFFFSKVISFVSLCHMENKKKHYLTFLFLKN